MIIPASVRDLCAHMGVWKKVQNMQRLAYTYISPTVVFPPEPIRSALRAPGRGARRTAHDDTPARERLKRLSRNQ